MASILEGKEPAESSHFSRLLQLFHTPVITQAQFIRKYINTGGKRIRAMIQTTKPKMLDGGEDVKRLTTRQIKTICIRHGWTCQMSKVPASEIQVDRRIVYDRRYRKSNAVMVAKSAGGRMWLCLGWRWDIEDLNEAQIVELLKALEQSHNNESTSFTGTTGTHA